MARIPDQVVERLKTDISVQRLAEARGVAFKKHGSDLIGRCPFVTGNYAASFLSSR
jgi:DNA primase